MPKRFDREEEPNDFMEAPCRCDCGNWFDQMDGHTSERKKNQLICGECADAEEAEIEREEEIREWKSQLEDAEFTVKEATRELKKLGALPVKSEDDLWEEVIHYLTYNPGLSNNTKISDLKQSFTLTKKKSKHS